MSDWEPTERRPNEPTDDAGADLPPTEPIPGPGEPPEELPIVPMSDEEPSPPPPPPGEPGEPVEPVEPVEPQAYEPTVVVPPTGPPTGGQPPTPGGPPPGEPWWRRPGPLATVIGVGLALIFLLVAFLIWASDDDDDQIATSDSSTSSTSSSTTSTSLVTTTSATTTTSSTPSTSSTSTTSTTSTSSTTTTAAPTTTTAAPTTTRAPTTTAAPTTTRPPTTTTTVPAITVPPAPGTTLWDIVRASPDLSRLEELIQQAGLVDEIDVADPITLFAPSDAAFELLEIAPGGSDLLDDPAQLNDLLLGHIVDGEAISADDLFTRDSVQVSNGETWPIDAADETVDGAGLPVVDVEGVNGLLHVVDKVLGT